MAWVPPRLNELKAVVCFEVRGPSSNVGGVVRADWVQFCPERRGRLLPLRGGEQVVADRAAGISTWVLDLYVQGDPVVRGLTEGMRVVDARDPARTWNILSILDLQGLDRWRTLTLQFGGSDG